MNRYNNYENNLIRYTPETFEERARVPIALRERHDALETMADSYINTINNAKIDGRLREMYAGQKIEDLNKEIDDLATTLANSGAGSMNTINKFKNLKRNVDRELSLSGGLGRAIDITKNLETQRELYMQHAVKMKHNAEVAKQWWESESGNYINELNPNVFSDPGYYNYDAFTAAYAPKNYDPVVMAGNLQKLMGTNTFQKQWQNTGDLKYDENTGQWYAVTNSGSTVNVDNLNGIKEVTNFIDSQMNPNSEMYAAKAYALGPGATDSDIKKAIRDELLPLVHAGTVTSKSSANSTTKSYISPKTDPTGNGGPTTKTDGTKPATLINSSNIAEKIEDGRVDVIELRSGQRLKELEAEENSVGLTEDKVREKNYLIQTGYLLEDKLKDPNVLKRVQEKIKELTGKTEKEILQDLENNKDIKNYKNSLLKVTGLSEVELKNKYDEYMTSIYGSNYNPSKSDVFVDNIPLLQAGQLSGFMKHLNVSGYLSEFDNVNFYNIGKAVNNSINLKRSYNETIDLSTLGYHRAYTFGVGEGSQESRNLINKGVTGIGFNNISSAALNSGGSITVDGKVISTLSNDDFSEATKNLSSVDTELSFNSIVDRGKSGNSYVLIDYKTKGDNPKKGTIKIDMTADSLKGNGTMNNILTEIYNNLDFHSQAVIDSIRDNIKYGSLSVDGQDYIKNGYSSWQDSKIKSLSLQDDLTKGLSNSPRFKSVDYLGNKNVINNVVLLPSGHHVLMQKDSKDNGPGSPLSFGNWFSKYDLLSNNDNPNYTGGYDEKAGILAKERFINNMLATANFLNDEDPLINVGSLSANQKEKDELKDLIGDILFKMKDTYDMSTYQSTVSGNKALFEAQYEQAMRLYNNIKDKPVMFKNSSRLIKGY